jgi:hypothetical protein
VLDRVLVQNNPINWVDPEGKETVGFEGHFIVGVGAGSFYCCDGNDKVHVKYFKGCFGAGFGASVISVGPSSERCDGIKPGDYLLGPELGIGCGVIGVEGGVSFNKKGASGYSSVGVGKGIIKATTCGYRIISVEKVGCCND